MNFTRNLTRIRPLAALLLAAFLELTFTGCAGLRSSEIAAQTAAPLPSWPGSPAQARVRYVRSIATPRDWGISKSMFRRLFDVLTGSGSEHFVRPTGVAEREGVLYIADPGAHALWILDAVQNKMLKVDRVGKTELVSPVAVAVRPDGAVYLADSRLKTVFLLDRAGKLLGVAAQSGLERPAGLAYDPASGRLYVADSAGQKIVVFGSDATPIRSWGQVGSSDGEFNYPTHLALDPTGALLVSDALNFRVQAFDADGRFLWKFGRHGDGSGDIASPKGIAADHEGHVFVVDALFDAVQIFERDGSYLLGFGERGSQPGQFWLPGGLFINSRNEVYVADVYNQRIQVFLTGPAATTESHQ
jgi:DNA-binding beta-propeller fold protein YncE